MVEKSFSITKYNFENVDAQKFLELSFTLAKSIQASGYRPEVIVCINRGGMILSRFLSDYLGVRDIKAIRVEHYSVVKKGETAKIVEPLPTKLNGEKVLLVDDIADTGETLKVAKKYLLQMGASEVKVATLHCKPWSSFKPDYFAEETDKWIVYFWELTETAKYLIEKLREEHLSEDEINRILNQEVEIPKYILQWINKNTTISKNTKLLRS
jgi:hypoxanthine phosphoribosyltransferase